MGLGDLGLGGLGDKETGCRYQSVHKQPFRLGLVFRGGTWGQGDRVQVSVYINNLLGWDLGTLGLGGDLCPLALQHASYLLLAAVYLGSAT